MKVYLLYRRGYPENKLLSVCKNKTAVKKKKCRELTRKVIFAEQVDILQRKRGLLNNGQNSNF